ncbi:MAG: hypothetical protein KDA20_01605 [Phycisphaerales bacterium]|nr:hypothetical protein [Phycisphaerales bacterium]
MTRTHTNHRDARAHLGLKSAALAVLVATGLTATGCNSAGEGAASGAAFGALVGMGLGSLSGDMGKGAAAGALIGAAGGAIIGDQNERNDRYNRNDW